MFFFCLRLKKLSQRAPKHTTTEGLFLVTSYVLLDYVFEEAILSVLNLHLVLLLDVFNRCSSVQLKK